MIKQLRIVPLILLWSILWVGSSLAAETWSFKRTWKSSLLIDRPFFLMAAGDLNQNGRPEIVVADFGRFGDHFYFDLEGPYFFNLFVFEWGSKGLNLKWQKKWDRTANSMDFRAYNAKQMVTWQISGRVIVETIPAYLGLEWINSKYVLREQQGPFNAETLVGSWALPWISPSCYPGFPNRDTYPRECLFGIRDFSGEGDPRIVTLFEEEIAKNKRKETLRVRRYMAGFPIEWERGPENFVEKGLDRLNKNAMSGLFVYGYPLNFRPSKGLWYILEQSKNDRRDYQLKPTQIKEMIDLYMHDLPDVYLRRTQKKDLWEYWGYHKGETSIPNSDSIVRTLLLKKVVLKPDLTGFVSERVDFPYHESFLDVGFFDLKDVDGDGLDEVILVEETGKIESADSEGTVYSNTKDYIRILKWNGKAYQTMWTSPPYTKRGTKFLVEDIKNTGKKQLVVMTGHGTIEVWEKE